MYFYCCLCLSAGNALNTSVTRCLCLSLLAEECHGIRSHPSDFSDHGPMCRWGCLLPGPNRLHVHGKGKKRTWFSCPLRVVQYLTCNNNNSWPRSGLLSARLLDFSAVLIRSWWREGFGMKTVACVGSVAECACLLHWWVILLVDLNCKWFSGNQRSYPLPRQMIVYWILFRKFLMESFSVNCFTRRLFLMSHLYFFSCLPFYYILSMMVMVNLNSNFIVKRSISLLHDLYEMIF